jgi:hypothetical protein
MGTRNLTKVIDKNGDLKVAQYGQWDGYPSGQGLNALYHANSHRQIEAGLARVRWAEQEELDKIYSSLPELNYLGTDDSNKFGLLYPNLTRDTCADILGVVAWSVGEVILVDQSDFEEDELMCEGVYTIDFQKRKFISKFGKVVEFDLDALPTPEQYLESWA